MRLGKRENRPTDQNISLFHLWRVLSILRAYVGVRLRKAANVHRSCAAMTETRCRQFAKTRCNAGCNGRNRNFLSNVFGRNRAIPAIVASLMRRDSERQRTEQNYPIVALVPIRQGYIIERIKYMYIHYFPAACF